MSTIALDATGGFWRRTGAMLLKEFLQLRRDRLTLATMITIPLMQLLLFGYAINTMPRDLPTAVLLQENSDVGRSILKALENTRYFKVTRVVRDEAEFDQLLQSGAVLFAVEVPANFERALRRGDRPALLVAADATDPVASGSALGTLGQLVQTALANEHAIPDQTAPAFDIRQHARYNPAGLSQLNIVPGLLGVILTLTMLIFTALSVTREIERGTMENLLAMPIRPLEIMLGKITPYIGIGFLQAALIVVAAVVLFGVPILGDVSELAVLTTLFVATNLSIGYTFSTHHALRRHQPVDRLHLLDAGAEPAPGRPDGNDVLSPQHAAVGLPVSLCRHAQVGPVCRRDPAGHPLRAHRPLNHAQGLVACGPAGRRGRAGRPHGGGHDDRGDAVSADAGLMDGRIPCGREFCREFFCELQPFRHGPALLRAVIPVCCAS